uniref:Uncharacterized protein n=1 Tax=Utricularia reniformis TaxID=192314 RepID=A0A1Y0AZ53_9LAMI|nr:hypothetical protein AEK19_MT0180 [Utricularia reniformis]ART30462.1 hypothetical protein AEK19_MT0180 [Utricularia reniformis]
MYQGMKEGGIRICRCYLISKEESLGYGTSGDLCQQQVKGGVAVSAKTTA